MDVFVMEKKGIDKYHKTSTLQRALTVNLYMDVVFKIRHGLVEIAESGRKTWSSRAPDKKRY